MDYLKTTLRVAFVFIILAAFVEVPYAAVIIAVLGLATGLQRDSGDLIRTIVIAIGLSVAAGALDVIPVARGYLTAILGNAAALAAASYIGVLLKFSWEQAGV